MFNIDAIFEDCKIHAQSYEGRVYTIQVENIHTGKITNITRITAIQLSYILQICLDPNGEPEGFDKMYESLKPLFKDWPVNSRPIP